MSILRRDATPSAVLHFPELVAEEQGTPERRLVVRCAACRWAAWWQMPVSLAEFVAGAERGVIHGKSVCVLNRCN